MNVLGIQRHFIVRRSQSGTGDTIAACPTQCMTESLTAITLPMGPNVGYDPLLRALCFLLRDADMHSAYLLRRRGWLSVTRRYCIKMAKPILKLFRPSGSHIILVSSDPYADTQFQGETLQRGC